MKFIEGESFKVGASLTIPEGDTIVALAFEFRGPNGVLLKRFSTKNATIATISPLNYSFDFADQSTLGKSGKGYFQAEIETQLLGLKKSPEYEYEIIKATARRTTTETPVIQSGYGAVVNIVFQAGSPTVQAFVGNFIQLVSTLEAEAARVAAEGFAQSAADNAEATVADRVATGEDREVTRLDRIATGEDREVTRLDRIATGEDRVATGLYRQATAADRVATGLDREATAQDAIATAADRIATGLDAEATAADREATGQDLIATEAARDEALAAVGNIMTLISYDEESVTVGIGGNITVVEDPENEGVAIITFPNI